ncbi:hypothetical protein V1503_10670 [Bacillus sp. SCS-151]
MRVVAKGCTTVVCKYETPTITRKWETWVYEDGSTYQACNCH